MTIRQIIDPRTKDLGGLEIRRVLPIVRQRSVGPFVFFDHIGPSTIEATGLSVRPHPHINLATVTYLFEGEIVHRDSLGVVQSIQPGAINWMTAGRGITHSERSPEDLEPDTRLHGVQLWVALPREHEEIEPSFHHHPADTLPEVEQNGARIRVLLGEAFGVKSPVATLSPMVYADLDLTAGATIELPDYEERAAYLTEGTIECAGTVATTCTMPVFESKGTTIRAKTDARLVLIGGAPLDGPRHIWWNFVSSRRERIEQAKADWRQKRFPAVPGDDSFIPLPD